MDRMKKCDLYFKLYRRLYRWIDRNPQRSYGNYYFLNDRFPVLRLISELPLLMILWKELDYDQSRCPKSKSSP